MQKRTADELKSLTMPELVAYHNGLAERIGSKTVGPKAFNSKGKALERILSLQDAVESYLLESARSAEQPDPQPVPEPMAEERSAPEPDYGPAEERAALHAATSHYLEQPAGMGPLHDPPLSEDGRAPGRAVGPDGLTDAEREAGYSVDGYGNKRGPDGRLADDDLDDVRADDEEATLEVETAAEAAPAEAVEAAPAERVKAPPSPRAPRAKDGNTIVKRVIELLTWRDPETGQGHPYQTVVDTVRRERPDSHVSLSSVRWYASHYKLDGSKLPDRPKRNRRPEGRRPTTSLIAQVLAAKEDPSDEEREWLKVNAPECVGG